MKKITFLLIHILGLAAVAQQSPQLNTPEFESLVKSEMRSARAANSFVANANTGNYDIGHQTLEFTVDPADYYIAGKVTSEFTAKQAMSSLTFDLSNSLTVSSVTRNGNSLTFSQNGNNELVINLGTTLATGQEATVVVNYSGTPGGDGFDADYHNGTPIISTISEPYGAKDWWPCKQDLNDKIDGVDVYITAPSQYVAVSNGVQQTATTTGGNTTTHFKHEFPIPAYLVAISVTNYTVYNQMYNGTLGSFPVVNYLYPETSAQNQPSLAQTLDIMQFYEDTFEQYPFHTEKYGHAQWNVGGGMEHTTVSFMAYFSRELIAHELAHQWFGDKITCGSWKDIWLNEGFATYLSGLVVEHQDGANEFKNWRYNKVANITAYPNGAVYLTDNDTLDEGRIFSSRLTYNKGSMVLHMLRKKIGDAAFYQGIKNYLADTDLAFAYAKTPDFMAHMETESGISLTEFFNDWVYNQGYPIYNVNVNSNGPGNAYITISQTQSDASVSFFEAPVLVRLQGTNGQTADFVLDNTVNNQTFTVPITFTVQSAEVNADYDLISSGSTVTLGMADLNANFGISLYPNPANDVLKAQLPDGVIINHATFYNNLGQKVFEATNSAEWNVQQLATGIHFIKLETTAGTVQLKFVKG